MIATFREKPTVSVDDIAVAGARQGDERAFERLYRSHVGRIYALCLRMTANRAQAEDCTQETFVKAWKSLPEFASRSAFGTWVHRIAVNTVLARARCGELDLQASLEDDAIDVKPDAHGGAESLADLEKMLQRLPGQARNIVVLYGLYGYTHEETADLVGVSVGACKVQLHRARKALRRYLREEEQT